MSALTLAAVFSGGCVLQREKPVPVWGTAPPGETVTVSLNGRAASVRAGEDGRWTAVLPAAPAGGPWTLAASCGGQTLRRESVFLGEVWLAGGQSNMELSLADSRNGPEAVRRSENPYLHYYQPARAAAPEEADRLEGSLPGWRTVGPDTAGPLSAVAYYAARTLSEHLPGIHIGVLVCCWGGTYAHCWLPREELSRFPEGQRRLDWYDARMGSKSDEDFARELDAYQRQVDGWNRRVADYRAAHPAAGWEAVNRACGRYPWPPPAGRTGFQRPGNLYASMLRRLCPYALRGFWYYQGEQDEEWPEDYFRLLSALIRRWRRDWGDGDLPFLLAQLPMYRSAEEPADPMRWPVLRRAQAAAAEQLPGVELAVLADCGEYDNIHPTDKETPGVRLGLLALESVYGQEAAGRPPVCVEARREGEAVLLRFDHTGGGLRLTGGGFQIAGADGAFQDAEAQVVSPDTVRVTGLRDPRAVRYAWYSFGPAGLYGGTGLAAAPLDWKSGEKASKIEQRQRTGSAGP